MSRRANGWMRLAQYGFTLVGIVTLGYCVAVLLEARFYQLGTARDFAKRLHLKAEGSATFPRLVDALPHVGAVIGRLEVPRVGISVMVIEGTDDCNLKRAVGHIPGTALPRETGNIGIAGHRDTFFRPLRDIQRDDAIDLVTLQAVNHYRVTSTQVVPPEDIRVLYPTSRDVLTLVTCFPFDYVGSAPKRFIVRAERLP
jgi:sortase A